jgi:hypothetical protein
MLQPTHWLHVFLVAVGHHFWPRLTAEIEQGRKTKNKSPQHTHLPPPKEREKQAYHECMLSLPIGCMKFLFSKLLVTIFGLG